MKPLTTLLAISLFTMSAVSSHATNLLTNGDFETDDFTGWTQSGNTSSTGVVPGVFGGISPESGGYQAYFGNAVTNSYLSQSVATIAGTDYNLTYYAAFINQTGDPSEFSVQIDGITLSDLNPVPDMEAYKQYSFVFQATSALTMLTFATRNDPAANLLDNVSISSVPEPANWAWVVGLVCVAVTMQRRIRNFTFTGRIS